MASLFRDWHESYAASADPKIRGSADEMVFDGFYPFYFSQPLRILFIGRESRGIKGCNYLEVLHDAYSNSQTIGDRSLNFDAFHSRKLSIAWGLLNGMPAWPDIPYATEIGDTFATSSGISFAFMNLSKLSNEGDRWQSDWATIGASQGASTRGRNFIREQVSLLAPNIIIAMNLKERLGSLGTLEVIEHTPDVNSYWLDSDGHRSLLLDTWHFALPGKNSITWFYEPICEAARRSGILPAATP